MLSRSQKEIGIGPILENVHLFGFKAETQSWMPFINFTFVLFLSFFHFFQKNLIQGSFVAAAASFDKSEKMVLREKSSQQSPNN